MRDAETTPPAAKISDEEFAAVLAKLTPEQLYHLSWKAKNRVLRLGGIAQDVDNARRTLELVQNELIQLSEPWNAITTGAVQLVIDSLEELRAKLEAADMTHKIVPQAAT